MRIFPHGLAKKTPKKSKNAAAAAKAAGLLLCVALASRYLIHKCSSELSHCVRTLHEFCLFCAALFPSLHCIYFSLFHFNISISVRTVLFSSRRPPGGWKGSGDGGRNGKRLAKVCAGFYTAVKTCGWERVRRLDRKKLIEAFIGMSFLK